MRRIVAAACWTLLLAHGARAAPAAGAACAAALSPLARRIYDVAAPDLHPGVKIPDLLRTKVRPMVMAGEIPRAAARPAAGQAGACLKALRDQVAQ